MAGPEEGCERQDLAIVTCSMPADLELFALLARSVDECADPAIPHRVVVPGSSLALFRPFANARREIIAQEDVLPVRLRQLPAVLRHASAIVPGLRRPLYLDRRLRLVKGWILQQLLKLEMTRTAPERAVMHVDSDVFFVRDFDASAAFPEGKPHFFRAVGKTTNPRHAVWIDTAAALLGAADRVDYATHYIENCVLWDRPTLARMLERIEAVQGESFADALIGIKEFSEYYVYGCFVDWIEGREGLSAMPRPFCRTFWPEGDRLDYDADREIAALGPQHLAMAVQSTFGIPPVERAAVFERVRADLGG